jgi:hypothetical protein
MSSIKLTCEETPLAWPQSVSLSDLTPCSTCGLKIYSPNSGSLQVLTRRQGQGKGDGVTIEESNSVGADYRGQRYSLEEAIFHTPGLHVFPSSDKVYSAEYHLHMRTMTAPFRYITIVLPISHKQESEQGTGSGPGTAYFSAIMAKPDPGMVRPKLDSLFVNGVQVLQYLGPDIRGRTLDNPVTDSCESSDEREFLLVLNVAHISAKDLERIPREGSLSSDSRDLPVPGIKPTKLIPRDRLVKSVVLADPGILGLLESTPKPKDSSSSSSSSVASVRVLVGEKEKDFVDISGNSDNIKKLFQATKQNQNSTEKDKEGSDQTDNENENQNQNKQLFKWVNASVMFLGVFTGLYVSNQLFKYVWGWFFDKGEYNQTEVITVIIFLLIAISMAGLVSAIVSSVKSAAGVETWRPVLDSDTRLMGKSNKDGTYGIQRPDSLKGKTVRLKQGLSVPLTSEVGYLGKREDRKKGIVLYSVYEGNFLGTLKNGEIIKSSSPLGGAVLVGDKADLTNNDEPRNTASMRYLTSDLDVLVT